MKKVIILFCSICFSYGFAQSSWKKIKHENKSQLLKISERQISNKPKKYSLYKLSFDIFKSSLRSSSINSKKIIELPTGNKVEKFYSYENSYLQDELAKQFPNIKSYTIQGIDNPNRTGKISIGSDGVHVVINTLEQNPYYIDPQSIKNHLYIGYKKQDFVTTKQFKCSEKSFKKEVKRNSTSKRNPSDKTLRTFRIAIAATNEYSLFHLQNQGVSSQASEEVKKSAVLSAINTTLTRVNDIYERDLAIRLLLVNNNDKIIFTNPNIDDNLDNSSPSLLLNQSQIICDNEIGTENYDIGHTFSTEGGGLAVVASVCFDEIKAKGITGTTEPTGDPFDIDFVAHEIGHQFGANHTFNGEGLNCSDGTRNNATAIEPGSGSTIMGYAGICDPQNIQTNTDGYFNGLNILQILENISNSSTCGKTINTSNSAPIANAGNNYTVPKSTPLLLKGSASDADGDLLTYCWEQIDNEVTKELPNPSNALGPVFRSLPPNTSSKRYLPKLETVISGSTSSKWEAIPNVARELNFLLTVRDNNENGGATGSDAMTITVIDAEPFEVQSQNTSSTTWYTESTQTISWNISTTNLAPINCKKVNIKLSVDGGRTFPITLAENTENDGIQNIKVPSNITDKARILVEASDNIFYDVNDTNFKISASENTFTLSNSSENLTICKNANTKLNLKVNVEFLNSYSEEVTLTASNLPNGVTFKATPKSVNKTEDVSIILDNLESTPNGEYSFLITGDSETKTQNMNVTFKVSDNILGKPTLKTPENSSENTNINPSLEWEKNPKASYYILEISKENNFSTIEDTITTTSNSTILKKNLNTSTNYFWRVKSANECGESEFSEIYSFSTQAAVYCSSNFSESNSEFIKNVTFNTINNDSGDSKTNGYENFTNIKTTVKPKEEHLLSVSMDINGFQDHCYAFIDWNQDYQFTDDEKYDLGAVYSDDEFDTLTKNIIVPENAKGGETRMRVLIEYFENNYGEGACDSDHLSEWGETEDYTIIVDNPNNNTNQEPSKYIFENLVMFPNPTLNEVNINFLKDSSSNFYIYIYDLKGETVKRLFFNNTNKNFSEKIDLTDLSSDIYFVEFFYDNERLVKKLIIK